MRLFFCSKELIMSSLVVEVVLSTDTPTVPVQAPAGSSFAGFSVALSDATIPAQVLTAAPYLATFVDPAPAVYTATLQAVDQNGKRFGPVFTSGEVTFEADISVDVPNVTSITLALGS
jgi:hypothetical protein